MRGIPGSELSMKKPLIISGFFNGLFLALLVHPGVWQSKCPSTHSGGPPAVAAAASESATSGRLLSTAHTFDSSPVPTPPHKHTLASLGPPAVTAASESATSGRLLSIAPAYDSSSGPTPRHQCALATMVSSDEYVIGAMCLLCSASRILDFASIPFYIIVDEDSVSSRAFEVLRRYAQTVALEVRLVKASNPSTGTHAGSEVRSATYTKLHLWRIEAAVVVYIDVDMIPNPSRSAVHIMNLFESLNPNDDIFVPGGNLHYWNSGVMVLRPNNTTYRELVLLLDEDKPKWKNTKNPTEQDLLIHYFKAKRVRFGLDEYNCRVMHIRNQNYNHCNMIHAIGNPKPWSIVLGMNTSVKGLKDDGHNAHPSWAVKLWADALHSALTGNCATLSSN